MYQKVAGRSSVARGLPQVYGTGQAREWGYLARYASVYYSSTVFYTGTLAQNMACRQVGCPAGANNTPDACRRRKDDLLMKPPVVLVPALVGLVVAAVLTSTAGRRQITTVGAMTRSPGSADARVVHKPGVAAANERSGTATTDPSASSTVQASASPSGQPSGTPTPEQTSSPAPKPTNYTPPPESFNAGGPPAILNAEEAQGGEPNTGTYTSGWRGALGDHLYIALVGSPLGDDLQGLATVIDLSLTDRVEQHLSAGPVGTLRVVSANNATGVLELQSSSGRSLQLDVVHQRFI